MSEYSIEKIPVRYNQDDTSACAVAVCLAKNNPLLCGPDDTEGLQRIYNLLTDLSTKHNTVYILVVDAINVFERLISNGTTRNQANRLADSEGSRIAQLYEKYAENLQLSNVEVVRWKEIQDPLYEERLLQLRKIVADHSDIAELLSDTGKFYIKRRNPSVTINDARVKYFEEYLLNEMVVQLHGIKDSKIVYHVVYVKTLEDAPLYQSPVLDLKCAFKKQYGTSDAFTARVFMEKPKQDVQ